MHPPFSGIAAPDSPTPVNSYNVNLQIAPGTSLASPLHNCQVDTGSCGIVVPESLLYVGGNVNGGQLLPGVAMGGPAEVIYQPSRNNLYGFYYNVAQLGVGVGASGGPAFVCENVTLIGASNATPGEGMMGVGFGRPTALGTNVFLNAGVNPSYLLTKDGIWLGYTPDTLPGADSFNFQQLTPANATADWSTPAAIISIAPPDGSPAINYTGNALLDTGVNLTMLGVNQPGWPDSLVGCEVTISWPGASRPSICAYSFKVTGTEILTLGSDATTKAPVYTVSGSSPMNPRYIVALGPKNPAFVNTGINVILGAQFYFDAKTGVIGFSPVSAS